MRARTCVWLVVGRYTVAQGYNIKGTNHRYRFYFILFLFAPRGRAGQLSSRVSYEHLQTSGVLTSLFKAIMHMQDRLSREDENVFVGLSTKATNRHACISTQRALMTHHELSVNTHIAHW